MTQFRIDRRRFLTALGATTAGLAGAGLAGLFAVTQANAAAGPNLTVGPARRVGAEGAKYFGPWIAANPRDAANLIVVGSQRVGEKFHSEPAARFTTNGGATWLSGEFAGAEQLRGPKSRYGDAFATYAPDGTAFCVFSGRPGGTETDLWIYRSSDGGRRWDGPTKIPGFLDYPRLVADLHSGKPRLFVAANGSGDGPYFHGHDRPGYGCVVLRSDDGAKSFTAVNLLAPTALLHTPIESPLILPDGRLLVGFADFTDLPEDDKPQAHISHNRFYAASSRDGGETFSLPAPIRDAPLRNGRGDGFASLAVDRSSGPHRGKIYSLGYNWSDAPAGLQLQTSVDGLLWSAPAAVPGLRAGPCPLAGMAVSSQGVLGLIWIQGAPGDSVSPFDKAWTSREHAWELHFTASADGGTTFAAPVSVLPSPCRTDPGMDFWPYGAENLALAASSDGAFHALWVDTRDGRGEIQTAKIEVQPES